MSARRICAALLIWAGMAAAQQKASTELQRAVEVFRNETRAMGLREDSPKQVSTSANQRSRWHGRLFENLRNDFLDAVPHDVSQRGGSKGMLRRNQFGVNLSGPVVIPKLFDGTRGTFFTFTFEGMRERIGRSLLRTIPTAGERIGDWSATVDAAGNPLPIYDPLTTAPNPNFRPNEAVTPENLQYNREVFPGNRIPVSRMDPVAKQVVQYYPAANTDAGPFFRNNYFLFAPEVNRANGVISRIDHTIRSRHRLGGGLNLSNGKDGAAAYFLTRANSGPVVRDRKSQRLTLDHVFTVSPQNVNTLSFDASSDQIHSLPERDENGRVFPHYQFQPYLSMGQSSSVFKSARNTFVLTDGFSTRMSQHRLRFVGQIVREQVNIYAPRYPEGNYTFTPGLTSLPGIVNTGHAFASFLLGEASFAEKSVVESPSYFRKSRFAATAVDQIELRKGLTVSLYFRLEMTTPRVEKYDRQSTVSLDAINPENNRPGALIVANRNGAPRAFQPFLTKGEPSASLAWNILGGTKTVLRTSYGRSYSPIPIYSVQWGTQAFNGNPTWLSSNPQLEPAVTLSQGLVPAQRFPDFRPEAANGTIAELVEPKGKQPTYQSAGVSLERELPGAALMTLGLGHANGRNLLLGNSSSNPNAVHLDALEYRDQLNEEEFNRSLRPYPQYRRFDIYSAWPEGRYQRTAGYVRLEKRTSSGLAMSAYYELSKQMDNYSGPYGVQDYFHREKEWALTSSNNPHRLTLTYNYELPFGANRLLLGFNDWRRFLVEGWSLSGVTTYVSGEPLAVHPQFNNTGNVVDALNVNVVPGVDPHVSDPGPDLWFNPAAFAQPPDFTIGNNSRTHPSLRMPSNQNHDLAVNKRFVITSDRSLEFSMVGLNFVNHANWNDPDTLIGPASAPNVNAGKIIGSRGGRVVQLGLRFSF